MPQVFRIGPYWVYFWANEGKPNEPVRNIMRIVEARSNEIIQKWLSFFGTAIYYC